MIFSEKAQYFIILSSISLEMSDEKEVLKHVKHIEYYASLMKIEIGFAGMMDKTVDELMTGESVGECIDRIRNHLDSLQKIRDSKGKKE